MKEKETFSKVFLEKDDKDAPIDFVYKIIREYSRPDLQFHDGELRLTKNIKIKIIVSDNYSK